MDRIEFKLSDVSQTESASYKYRYAISLSLEFLAISLFPQLLRCKTDMVASYRVVPYLQRCYA